MYVDVMANEIDFNQTKNSLLGVKGDFILLQSLKYLP